LLHLFITSVLNCSPEVSYSVPQFDWRLLGRSLPSPIGALVASLIPCLCGFFLRAGLLIREAYPCFSPHGGSIDEGSFHFGRKSVGCSSGGRCPYEPMQPGRSGPLKH